MKKIIYILLLGFSFSLSAQDFYERVEPTSEGDKVFILVTQKAYEKLVLGLKKLSQEVDVLRKQVKGSNVAAKIDEWEVFKNSLRFYSKSKFESEYNERELVEISMSREKLPDFLKSTKGTVKEKRNWFYKNVNEINKY